jgi:hypothetical protein
MCVDPYVELTLFAVDGTSVLPVDNPLKTNIDDNTLDPVWKQTSGKPWTFDERHWTSEQINEAHTLVLTCWNGTCSDVFHIYVQYYAYKWYAYVL